MADRTPLEKQREIENHAALALIAERLGRIIELLTPALEDPDDARRDPFRMPEVEEAIRDAMTEAQAHPGRTITR